MRNVQLGLKACLALSGTHVLEQVKKFPEADATVSVEVQFVKQLLGDHLISTTIHINT